MKAKVIYRQVTGIMLLCLINAILFAQTADDQLIKPVESQTTENPSSLRLYPNPSTGSFTVEYKSAKSGKVHLKVVDMGGKQVFTAKEAVIQGTNTYHLNLNKLASGIYILEVIHHHKEINRTKFVIQKS